jgi:hypothetical protein
VTEDVLYGLSESIEKQKGKNTMLMMSIWIQDKIAAIEPLSNAVFCVWLSLAGLLPSVLMEIV